ncbi:MAG: methyltransferase [Nanoarchaeota archaeon]|mgnify:CR=1 FL=1
MITEGKAKIAAKIEKIPTRKMEVFYNPVMKLNRDISIALLTVLNEKNLVVADPLAGSGVRAIRFLKELPKRTIKKIYVNDRSSTAVASIKKNLKINKISKKIIISQKDANEFLKLGKFDYIDIDPFGYPGPFIDNAFAAINAGGILAVTATDTAALCGSARKACIRKYKAVNSRNWMMHETGLRILIGWAARKAEEYGLRIQPLLSYSKEHYMRTFCYVLKKGKHELGFSWLCSKCLSFGIGRKEICCKGKTTISGPLWTGRIGKPAIVKKVNKLLQEKFISTLLLDTESKVVGHYDLHEFASRHKLPNLPPLDEIALEIKGSRTHFNPHGIKTGKKPAELLRIIRKCAERQ